ncbi:MAG: TldD/PmbA family protein [Gemmatimonadales bacterium]|nr:TldD/PmbA family protein [Gemmatimonadales bacterium]
MPEMTDQQMRQLMERALGYSKAEACEINIFGSQGGNIRYARNSVSTAGANEDTTLVVQSNFGSRTGTVTINEFDDATLARAVQRSEELARLAPEDPEFMGPMGPQQYAAVNPKAYSRATATITPEFRTRVAKASIDPASSRDCTAAGFFQDSVNWQGMMNSKGLAAFHRQTGGSLSVTVRSNDGTGSGYVSRDFNDVSGFNPESTSAIALEKAVASRNPKAIEPGKYTVILEPEAGVEMLQVMIGSMDARSADEGRSFLAKAGGTRVGEKLVDERVTIYSDPADPDVPSSPWIGDGRAVGRTNWIDRGVVANLYYSRYWAQKQGKPATPFPTNMIMSGGNASLEAMIRDTSRGVLVTRFWYIRFVDPQTLLLTGLTRDATFYVENGQIKHAIKNLRFNESPVIMLNNIDALGAPIRVQGSMIPPMRVRDFTFTSLSEAV